MAERSMPVLLQRLRSVHEHLSAAGYDHAVGGALALAVHVEPRFTADIDLNITADADRPEGLLATLPDDLEQDESAAATLRSDGQLRLWWRHPSTALDIFLPQHPTYHHLVVERAIPVDFLGEGIKVITPTDLVIFKSLFNRPKDWVDIEALLTESDPDVDEALTWLAEFLGEDNRLDRLRSLAKDTDTNSRR